MAEANRKTPKNGYPNRVVTAILSLLIVTAIALGTVTLTEFVEKMNGDTASSQDMTSSTQSDNTPTSQEYTATIAATGDLLIHEAVFKAALQEDDSYSFDHMFQYFKSYVSSADYAVANLETTLAGTELGYKYSGYPCFNSPDGLVNSAKNAGFDMLLTANNHSYDTRLKGMLRTIETIDQSGLDRLGSRKNTAEKCYVVKEVNNIKVGMICYTYETDGSADSVALNGIDMTDEAAALINTFSYSELDTFYNNMQSNITAMKADGAEAVMLFIHWGDEYKIKQNNNQQKIAQKMCDLGVDVIVGGHPHVVQPIELLTSTNDTSKKTVCLYSMGNTLSNMPNSYGGLPRGYCQDGVLFSVTFHKATDGKVSVKGIDLLPIFNNIYTSAATGTTQYELIPLDKSVSDWQTAFNLVDATVTKCEKSYDRTMEIVGEGLKAANEYFAANNK